MSSTNINLIFRLAPHPPIISGEVAILQIPEDGNRGRILALNLMFPSAEKVRVTSNEAVSVIWQQPRVGGTGRPEAGISRWGSKVWKILQSGLGPSGRNLWSLVRSYSAPCGLRRVPEAWLNSSSFPRCAACIPGCLSKLEQSCQWVFLTHKILPLPQVMLGHRGRF